MKEYTNLLNSCTRAGISVPNVFDDWITMAYISLRNRSTPRDSSWLKREKEYLNIFHKYSKKERETLMDLTNLVINNLTKEPSDILGKIYEHYQMGNSRLGQFFTPDSISMLLASLTMNEHIVNAAINHEGYYTISDPTCGSGATLIHGINRIKDIGANTTTDILVVGQDISLIAAKMCFIQLSILDVPAIIYYGDTIRNKVHDAYLSPRFIRDRWYERNLFDSQEEHTNETNNASLAI